MKCTPVVKKLQLLKEKLSKATCELRTMNFPIDNKFVEVAANQSWYVGVWPQIAITKQKMIEKCYSHLLEDASIHKDWSHATSGPADNLPFKIKI